MKILYVTTIGITMIFFKDLIRQLLDEGHSVDILCNEEIEKVPDCYREWGCTIHHHTASRSPFAAGNFRAVRQIRELVSENNYDIVHCHTPIAAACTRLACRPLRKKGLKVVYTAHGFHFYKGAPLKNWLFYYPVEKFCSHYTDILITINREDYAFAQRKMKAVDIAYVPGVGINLQKFSASSVSVEEKRAELGIPDDAFLLLSVGELNRNKNHEVILRAMSLLSDPNIHYAIAGTGDLREYLLSLSEELGIRDHVHLLGYRNDVAELYRTADVFVFPSFREGLSVSLMEAMASGLPCIVSDIRGNRDLIVSERCSPENAAAFAGNIRRIKEDGKLRSHMQSIVTESIKSFEMSVINEEIRRLYQQILV